MTAKLQKKSVMICKNFWIKCRNNKFLQFLRFLREIIIIFAEN